MSWKSLCIKWLPLLESKDIEIEQLKKEKEWLLNYCLFLEYRPLPVLRNEAVENNILHQMQQTLKEECDG